jgi:hypothetical protein
VGKTALFRKFSNPSFTLKSLTTTVGMDFHNVTLPVDGRPVELAIWDTV